MSNPDLLYKYTGVKSMISTFGLFSVVIAGRQQEVLDVFVRMFVKDSSSVCPLSVINVNILR